MRSLALIALLAACGDDHKPQVCPGEFAAGDLNGHPDPLGASATEARAGRIRADQLPAVPSGLVTWQDGDFVLANDRVAIVIEDVGDSDLYDPWGGRPVGLARVEGGKLVDPANFGEFFVLTGRSTVVTDSVSVIADGSDGGPAIIRARGKLHPLPFFESIISVVYNDEYTDIDAAIDYELAPGSEHVDIRVRYASPRAEITMVPSTLHAFMYAKRMPLFQPGAGFDDAIDAPWIAFVDDRATSWAYIPGDGSPLASSLSVSGFVGVFAPGFALPACGTTDRLHAQIVIGGPGVDGVQAAVARTLGQPQRAITGTLTRTGAPVAGMHVHALDGAGHYLTRATTAADGTFALHVPADTAATLVALPPGDAITAPAEGSFALPDVGYVHVTATENGAPVPARVQVLTTAASPDHKFGEPPLAAGRIYVEYPATGDITLPLPPGTWNVVVSRGYEYELVQKTVTVTANQTVALPAALDRVVATTNVQCGDFHVHTWRSNDSGDPSLQKVAQAVADGVELPVRSDHEYVADFSAEIAALGVGAFAYSIGSIELTSFEVWGHMGVVPLTPDPARVNAGAPKWQSFPTASAPDTPFATLSPTAVFDTVRARPEAPVVIINHPHDGKNYFPYVGYDPATGIASDTADWDTKFTLVEVFNDSDWKSNRSGTVADWLGMLRAGRKVFAVGSSDSHGISGSPVGYPRTCIALGTDDPRALTPGLVRDQLAAGHATVSGGIYVDARLGTAAPGDTTTGAGSPQMLDVTVQAASWVDVTALELIVDGATADTIPIMPSDADPGNPTVRWRGQLPIQTHATGGFVIVAAYGTQPLEPVHPGRIPFGVTNPIFVTP